MNEGDQQTERGDNDSQRTIAQAVQDILRCVDPDPTREGLKDTPRRVASALTEMLIGYYLEPKDILSTTFGSDGYDQIIALREVDFFSLCEHHMLPFFGTVTVAYLPAEGEESRVVGLSKLARLVECYARRLQIQERMTKEIMEAIRKHLNPRGIGVVVKAQHLCMAARGVSKQRSEMITSALYGRFRDDPSARQEFFSIAGL
jgi:GTP cyclohydrolase I